MVYYYLRFKPFLILKSGLPTQQSLGSYNVKFARMTEHMCERGHFYRYFPLLHLPHCLEGLLYLLLLRLVEVGLGNGELEMVH